MKPEQPASQSSGVSRRDFIKGLGVASGAGVLHGVLPARADADREGIRSYPADGSEVVLTVNGQAHRVAVRPSDTLLHVLREKLDLTGAKKVCDRGACGACTVLIGGKSVNACMVLALDAVGAEVTTVEGLSTAERLDPVQLSFIRNDACQCGYCIPGFVVRTKALLSENPHPSLMEIKHGLAGNVCRCGAYRQIFVAVQDAADGVSS